jgi:hypothetical protein
MGRLVVGSSSMGMFGSECWLFLSAASASASASALFLSFSLSLPYFLFLFFVFFCVGRFLFTSWTSGCGGRVRERRGWVGWVTVRQECVVCFVGCLGSFRDKKKYRHGKVLRVAQLPPSRVSRFLRRPFSFGGGGLIRQSLNGA